MESGELAQAIFSVPPRFGAADAAPDPASVTGWSAAAAAVAAPYCKRRLRLSMPVFRSISSTPELAIDDGERVNLDEQVRQREAAADHPGAAVLDAFEVLVDHRVDRLAVLYVGHVHGQLADVLDAAARFLRELLDILAGLFRLRAGVAFAHKVALDVVARLPAEEDVVALRADGHREHAVGVVAVRQLGAFE